jgi:hypothetical protein
VKLSGGKGSSKKMALLISPLESKWWTLPNRKAPDQGQVFSTRETDLKWID